MDWVILLKTLQKGYTWDAVRISTYTWILEIQTNPELTGPHLTNICPSSPPSESPIPNLKSLSCCGDWLQLFYPHNISLSKVSQTWKKLNPHLETISPGKNITFLPYIFFPTPHSQRVTTGSTSASGTRNPSVWLLGVQVGWGDSTAPLSSVAPQAELRPGSMVSLLQRFSHTNFSGLVVNLAILEKTVLIGKCIPNSKQLVWASGINLLVG